jgi:MOSC domain-containing protein YiiM
MQGTVVQLSISPGGLPKRAVSGAPFHFEGLAGDAHAHPGIHGGPRKAILLIAAETVDHLVTLGYPVFYGALGENVTTRGIDTRELRIGDRLQIGGAVIEITQPRGPCTQLNIYGESIRRAVYDKRVKALEQGSPLWGMSGLYASVVFPGQVRPGDIIAVVNRLA